MVAMSWDLSAIAQGPPRFGSGRWSLCMDRTTVDDSDISPASPIIRNGP